MQRVDEFFNSSLFTLHHHLNARVAHVPDEADEAVARGQPVDKRSESDSLHNSCDCNLDAGAHFTTNFQKCS